jgi:hypothetical protein
MIPFNARTLALSVVALVGAQGSCVPAPPGGACPVTHTDRSFVSSASIGVVGPGVVRGCEVTSRTEFRATARVMTGPGTSTARARFGIVGANFNGAPCTVMSREPWLSNTRFIATTSACATPGAGTYFGDIILHTPVLGFTVRSSF